MTSNWEDEMQDKFDKLQAALTAEFRTQLTAMGAQLEERLEQRLEKRLDERLSHRLNMQTEELREIVRTTADNYGGVLAGIRRDVVDFRDEWRKKAEVTDMVLANHAGRIVSLEQTISGD